MPPGRSEPIDSSCLHRLLLWYGARFSAFDRPDHFIASTEGLSCSGFKNDVYFMRGKSRDIPCGSPLEDDQVVRRCLLTISAFCSRLRGVWSSCSLPCSAPSAPFRCAYDMVLAGYARTCADTIMWASFVHALLGSCARVSARLWST